MDILDKINLYLIEIFDYPNSTLKNLKNIGGFNYHKFFNAENTILKLFAIFLDNDKFGKLAVIMFDKKDRLQYRKTGELNKISSKVFGGALVCVKEMLEEFPEIESIAWATDIEEPKIKSNGKEETTLYKFYNSELFKKLVQNKLPNFKFVEHFIKNNQGNWVYSRKL